MAREITWTLDALDDLKSAAEYIELDSPYHAGAFVQAVFQAADSLTDFAERGRLVSELESENLRELLVGRYRLTYRVKAARVIILRIIHGSRDFRSAWSVLAWMEDDVE